MIELGYKCLIKSINNTLLPKTLLGKSLDDDAIKKMRKSGIDICREKGYKRIFLLTITAQVVARHVYETHGFYKTGSFDKSEWGDGVVEERWELKL